MPFPTKLQLIKRKASQQFYVNFPSAAAQMLDFQLGEQLEWILLDRSQLVLNRLRTPAVKLKKTPQRLVDVFAQLFAKGLDPSARQSVNAHLSRLALSAGVALGRSTITGLLHAASESFQDWSTTYRLFSQQRVEPQRLLAVARREVFANTVLAQLPNTAPLVVAIDDTLVEKSSAKTPGVSCRRDPLGPKFQANLILAQRFLQFSAALPARDREQPARLIPIALEPAPTPRRPPKKAPSEVWKQYRIEARQCSLTARAAARIKHLRAALNDDPGGADRELHLVVDGAYTNRTVFGSLPAGVTLIGLIRTDAKLYHLPAEQPHRGRKRCYGERAPTPEQLCQDDSVPWQTVEVFAAGRLHQFQVKTLAPLRWRPAGGKWDKRRCARRMRSSGCRNS